MATKEMTTREALVAVINGEVTEDVIEKLTSMVEKIDEKNAKAKEKRDEKKAEKAEADKVLYDTALEFVTGAEGEVTATEVFEGTEGFTSRQKASRILNDLVEAGKLEKVKTKRDKKSVIGYKIVSEGTAE